MCIELGPEHSRTHTQTTANLTNQKIKFSEQSEFEFNSRRRRTSFLYTFLVTRIPATNNRMMGFIYLLAEDPEAN